MESAPALSRGIEILSILVERGALSLERLAETTGWPKSSILRMLQTLEAGRIVLQEPATKEWRALMMLTQMPDPGGDPLFDYYAKLAPLAEHTQCTCELYSVKGDTVMIVERAEPVECFISVVAKVGYQRDLSELEATSMLYYAYNKEAVPSKLFYWDKGEKGTLGLKGIRETLKHVTDEQFSEDFDFNINGIRRFAIPLVKKRKLVGILAVAQHQTPRANQDIPDIRRALKKLLP